MVVQHNITAMNSNRMLNVTTKAQSKSTEKLSSGYKINRAADDAAGLSISEKMRKQIRGLTQASSNAQDGISAVQTAEGALTEVHDMLQRMNELAVKSANGTNSKDDRDYIQAEVNQLVTEIDRVATTTKFNETYLLKGTNSDGTVGKLTFDDADTALNVTFDTDGIYKVEATDTANQTAPNETGVPSGGYAVGAGDETKYTKSVYTLNGKTYTLVKDVVAGTAKKSGNPDVTVTTNAAKIASDLDTADANADHLYYSNEDDLLTAIKTQAATDGGANIKNISKNADGSLSISAFADLNSALSFSLHVGADSSKDNKIEVSVNMMSARGLGINGIKVDGADGSAATNSINTIADAIKSVSSARSALGAVQNRLEHTINNLDNVVENTTSAESAIRDTDMATEMVSYSNNNILAQAGQAMLAQANQSNQGVLSLLG